MNWSNNKDRRDVYKRQGHVCANGSPGEVLTEDLIYQVYGVHAHVFQGQEGYPYIQYIK